MKKLLVVRDDRLGDLMLILPALRLIKSSMRDIQIDCLVNKNYSDISLISNDIKNTLHDDGALIEMINKKNYDFSISFFSTLNIAYKLWRTNIRKRYAPATKSAQFFYNKKIIQKRSESKKAEYEYNLDLASFFLNDNKCKNKIENSPYINLTTEEVTKSNSENIIYIHPFTGGSSKTLSSTDFITLCKELQSLSNCTFVIHCDENDYEKCKKMESQAPELNINTITPTKDIKEMFININKCDLFIAGSTGPLHVAAALNKKTVGFYPTKKSSNILRWDTINNDDFKLSFNDEGDDNLYIKVNLKKIALLIKNKLLS